MDLTPYVETLRRELAVAAEAGGDEARALAERLTAPLDSAIRLMLLDALSAAADDITLELAPGSVELRLRGGEPDFVVTPAPADEPPEPPAAAPPPPEEDDGPMARINLRLPEQLKVERRAGRRPRAALSQRLARPRRRRRGGERRPRQRGGRRRPAAGPDRPGLHRMGAMTFDTPEPISATINVVVGDVRISAGDRDTTVVEVQPSDPSNDEDRKAAEQTARRVRRAATCSSRRRSCAPGCRAQHRRLGRRDGRAAGRLERARRRAAGGLPLRRPARRHPDHDRPRPHPRRRGRAR